MRKRVNNTRHTTVALALAKLCNGAGLATEIEPCYAPTSDSFNTTGLRLDIAAYSGSASFGVDVRISHPSCVSYSADANTQPLHTALCGEAAKRRKYAELALREQLTLVPFVLESFGAMGPSASKFLDTLSQEAESSAWKAEAFRRHARRVISFALQRGNAQGLAIGVRNFRSALGLNRSRTALCIRHDSELPASGDRDD